VEHRFFDTTVTTDESDAKTALMLQKTSPGLGYSLVTVLSAVGLGAAVEFTVGTVSGGSASGVRGRGIKNAIIKSTAPAPSSHQRGPRPE
jgi:hypothetical protein